FRSFSPAAYSSGFLGPQYAPLLIADNAGNGAVPAGGGSPPPPKGQDLEPAGHLPAAAGDSRTTLPGGLGKDFAASRPDVPPSSHKSAVERAVRLMKTEARKAFDLGSEKDSVRDAYGKNLFGQGCLLARRLVEQGVPFVEVNLGSINGGGIG